MKRWWATDYQRYPGPEDVQIIDDDAEGCGFCLHVWHDDNPCGGDTWAGICECPSSERA